MGPVHKQGHDYAIVFILSEYLNDKQKSRQLIRSRRHTTSLLVTYVGYESLVDFAFVYCVCITTCLCTVLYCVTSCVVVCHVDF